MATARRDLLAARCDFREHKLWDGGNLKQLQLTGALWRLRQHRMFQR